MAAVTRHDTGGAPVIARPGLFHARMAGVSGAVFAVLFAVGLVLLRQAPDLEAPDSEDVAFYTSGSGDVLVALGLYIVPFAGIAWWLAVASYVVAAFLLASVTFHPAILLVFPAWVLMMSVLLLVHRPIGETP